MAIPYKTAGFKPPERYVLLKVYQRSAVELAPAPDAWTEFASYVPPERVKPGQSKPECGDDPAVSAKRPIWQNDGSVKIDVVNGCLARRGPSADGQAWYANYWSEVRYTLVKENGTAWKVVKSDLIARH